MDLSPVADEFIPAGWISLRDAVVRGAKFMCGDDLAREFTDAEVKQLAAFGHQYQRAEIAGNRTGMNTHLPVPLEIQELRQIGRLRLTQLEFAKDPFAKYFTPRKWLRK